MVCRCSPALSAIGRHQTARTCGVCICLKVMKQLWGRRHAAARRSCAAAGPGEHPTCLYGPICRRVQPPLLKSWRECRYSSVGVPGKEVATAYRKAPAWLAPHWSWLGAESAQGGGGHSAPQAAAAAPVVRRCSASTSVDLHAEVRARLVCEALRCPLAFVRCMHACLPTIAGGRTASTSCSCRQLLRRRHAFGLPAASPCLTRNRRLFTGLCKAGAG